jgi:hypothetical protein
MNEQMEALLMQAALMRAAGFGWKTIALTLQRSESTVRHWPVEYREQWSIMSSQAMTDVVGEAFGEAVRTLRQGMRSQQEKLRIAASVAIAKIHGEQQRLEMQGQRPARRVRRAAIAEQVGGKQLNAAPEREPLSLLAAPATAETATSESLPSESGNDAA